MMKYLPMMTIVLSILALPAQAQGDAAAGKTKSATCVACHGVAGKVSAAIYPNLAGQNVNYLNEALQAYKKGARSGGQAEIMRVYVASLSDQDISDLAAYYASLKP